MGSESTELNAKSFASMIADSDEGSTGSVGYREVFDKAWAVKIVKIHFYFQDC